MAVMIESLIGIGGRVLRTGEASHRLRVQDHPGTAGSLAEKRKKSVPAAHGASAG